METYTTESEFLRFSTPPLYSSLKLDYTTVDPAYMVHRYKVFWHIRFRLVPICVSYSTL